MPSWESKVGMPQVCDHQDLLLSCLPSGCTLVFGVLLQPSHIQSSPKNQLKSRASCPCYFLAQDVYYSLTASQFRPFYFLCSSKLLRGFSFQTLLTFFVNVGELTGICYGFSPLFTASEKDINHSRHSLITITAIKAIPFPLSMRDVQVGSQLGLLLFCSASPGHLPFLSTHGDKTHVVPLLL